MVWSAPERAALNGSRVGGGSKEEDPFVRDNLINDYPVTSDFLLNTSVWTQKGFVYVGFPSSLQNDAYPVSTFLSAQRNTCNMSLCVCVCVRACMRCVYERVCEAAGMHVCICWFMWCSVCV